MVRIKSGARWVKWSIGAAAIIFLVGCQKRQPAAPGPVPQQPPAVVGATPPPAPPPRVSSGTPPVAPPPAPTEDEVFARASLADLNASKPLDDTFFQYDRADLSDAGRASLQRAAGWLRRWPTTRVRVEGHADERGTNEYNLALGERRAAMTRAYLVDLGIDQSRIAIVSKGKETPFCREMNEHCWQQNRRGHFIITAK